MTDEAPASFQAYLGWMVLFIAVLLGASWLWTIKEPLRYHDPDYSVWRAKLTLLEQPDARLMILGDSCAEDDLLPERLGPGVVNLGSAGTTPVDTYFLAEKIVARESLPRAVIISFAPFHFINPTPDLFWARATFDTLTAQQLDDIRRTSRELNDPVIFGNHSPVDVDARLKIALLSLKFPSFDGPALMKTVVASRYRDNLAAYDATIASRGQHYRDVVKESDRLDESCKLKDFTPTKLIDSYFNRMIALFASRGVPVYFLGMPHREISDPYYSVLLRDKFARYLDGYAARYPNFHVLPDPLPCYPMKYFGDYAHLNEDGVPVWSDHSAEVLNQAHVEGGPFGPGLPKLTESPGR